MVLHIILLLFCDFVFSAFITFANNRRILNKFFQLGSTGTLNFSGASRTENTHLPISASSCYFTYNVGIYSKDDFVFWSAEYVNYSPPIYTTPHINGQPWADPDIGCVDFQPKWNQLDGAVNRVSFNGIYKIENGLPINPIGRTGLSGRGLLGRWGPNHAADPVVTRWKRNADGSVSINSDTQKKILQMVAIQRHDNKMWAIPGGMVDPGEKISATLKREFMEEALDSCETQKVIEDFFAKGNEIYKGYVDDFRNTDNAWMETVAYNFHDDSGAQVGKLALSAGDDAANVKWLDIDSTIKLHANHIDIIKEVIKRLNAYW